MSWWYERPLPGHAELRIVLSLEPGIYAGAATESEEQTLRELYLTETDGWGGKEQPFSTLDPISANEMILDVERLLE